jgi:hypothetical protein
MASVGADTRVRLLHALDAVENLKNLNAALENRVKELESELAACKAQNEASKPNSP